MTSHPVTTYVSDLSVDVDGEADVLSPFCGILMGIALCVPFWAVVYFVFRAM